VAKLWLTGDDASEVSESNASPRSATRSGSEISFEDTGGVGGTTTFAFLMGRVTPPSFGVAAVATPLGRGEAMGNPFFCFSAAFSFSSFLHFALVS